MTSIGLTSSILLVILIGCLLHIEARTSVKSKLRKLTPDDEDSGKINGASEVIQSGKGGNMQNTKTEKEVVDEDEEEGGPAEPSGEPSDIPDDKGKPDLPKNNVADSVSPDKPSDKTDKVADAVQPNESSDKTDKVADAVQPNESSDKTDKVADAVQPNESSDKTDKVADAVQPNESSDKSDKVADAVQPNESSDKTDKVADAVQPNESSDKPDKVADAVQPNESSDKTDKVADAIQPNESSDKPDDVADAVQPNESSDKPDDVADAVQPNESSDKPDKVADAVQPNESSDKTDDVADSVSPDEPSHKTVGTTSDTEKGASVSTDKKKRSCCQKKEPQVDLERKKRLAYTSSYRKWPKAIIPYKFTSSVKDYKKVDIRAVFSFYERHTCAKYVPESEAAQYDLGHYGYLNFKQLGSCWSMVGNMRKAQTISCCGRNLCIHENGHAIGLIHEQMNSERDGFIRIEWENIRPASIKNFVEQRSGVTNSSYDFSSIMHYHLYTFSKNRKQTITELIEAPDFILGGKYYYLLQQVSQVLSCKDVGNCDDIACENDGYVTVKRGKCACVCPDGLEPSTGCTTPKKTVTGLDWPPGTFALLKSKGSCPSGFKEGSVKMEGNGDNEVSDGLRLDGDFNKKTHEYHFCVQDESSESEAKWETGNYCINKQGDSCPEGFESGSITISGKKGGDNSHTGDLPAGTFGDDVTFDYCCRSDGITFDPIILPSDTSFTMYPKYINCQAVEGMTLYKEDYEFDAEKVTITGDVPRHKLSSNKITMVTCHYTPITYDCGGVIDLTTDSPSQTFSSPTDGDNYPNGVQCTWLIKGPTKSKMVLDFDEFDIEGGSSGCADYVETRTMRVGHPGLRYCGKHFGRSVLSQWNTLIIVLKTDDQGQAKGFKATVRMVPWADLSFSIEDRGESYNGKINYTSSSEPCLNWREMTMCRHYSTNPEDLGDRLEENYCRNPGHGFQPWCFIRKEGCIRNYCDVSALGKIYDTSADCAARLSEDPDLCSEYLIAMGCMKTCRDKLSLHTPTAMQKCDKPEAIPDADLVAAKDSYDVGEKVTYECSSDKATTLERTCLTDGTWSPGGYVCGDCLSGWTRFGGHCYKYFDEELSYPQARAVCKENNGDITCVLSQEEQDFLATLKKPENKIWISLTKVDKTWKWEGVTSLSYSNWVAGEPYSKKGRKKWIKHAYMLNVIKNNKWKPTGAWKRWPKMSFVCKSTPSSTRSTCADRRADCGHEISEMPTICENHAEFAWQQCPKSCGVCDADSAGTCDVPANGDHVVKVTGGATLKQGESVTYKCENDYGLSTGNLERACLDGQLTGSEPECVEISKTKSLTYPVDLFARSYVPGNFRIYIGGGDEFKITRSGEITKFEVYTLYSGYALLQVYRPIEGETTTMTLIGNHYVHTRTDQIQIFEIAEDKRTKVEAGDFLAVWYDEDRAGICYSPCLATNKNGLQSQDYIYWPSNFKVGNEYDFVVNSRCQIFSLRAEIGPIS